MQLYSPLFFTSFSPTQHFSLGYNRELMRRRSYLWYELGSCPDILTRRERSALPRRGENIRKRKDGRWEARYPNGVNEKGATKYTSIYGDTYREVKEKRNLAVQQLALPTIQQKEYPLFKEVLHLWVEDNRVNLKDSTIYRYNYLIDTHIAPELGGMRMDNSILHTTELRYDNLYEHRSTVSMYMYNIVFFF